MDGGKQILTVRPLVVAFGVVSLFMVALPNKPVEAVSLALMQSDYPHGAHVVALPATNAEADHLLGPVHRSHFDALHRIDGEGWLQTALWHFRTGKGRETRNHQMIFGYGINVFSGRRLAEAAAKNVKIPTKPYRVAHLGARIYQVSDIHQTLVFVFFVYRSIEVEAYFEYQGVAPGPLAHSLHHRFNRQAAHLARIARLLFRSRSQAPPTRTPTSTLIPTSTSTATLTPTSTPTPTTTAVPTSTPTQTPTSVPTSSPVPTATTQPTPSGLEITAQMDRASYKPHEIATLTVTVAIGGQPVAGAIITAKFFYPQGTETCTATSNAQGVATCLQTVPALPNGTQIYVQVNLASPDGESGQASTTFTILTS